MNLNLKTFLLFLSLSNVIDGTKVCIHENDQPCESEHQSFKKEINHHQVGIGSLDSSSLASCLDLQIFTKFVNYKPKDELKDTNHIAVISQGTEIFQYPKTLPRLRTQNFTSIIKSSRSQLKGTVLLI